jgi:hypothetical protein
MASIRMSNGKVGHGSTGPAVDLPLRLIEERLCLYKVHYEGADPKEIAPVTQYYSHVVVEVSGIDDPTVRFTRQGFYRVLGLHTDDAGFLTAPRPGTVLR